MKSQSLRFRIRTGSQPAAAASVERVVEVESREGAVVIGRRRGQGIELPFAAVSDQHARVSRGDQGWLLAALGSANGTFLNGHRLPPFVPQALSVGAVLRLASVELVFEGETRPTQGAEGRGREPESTATLARRLVSDLFGTSRPAEVVRLLVMDGPAQGRELRLDVVGCRFRVGRGTDCNLVVPDDDISREHAEFERRWDGVFVRDLHSKNGVLLGGERLAGEHRLSDGDVLCLGQTSFRLEDPEDRYLRQMEEVQAQAVQTAKAGAGAESAVSGDSDGQAGTAVVPDTRTSSSRVTSSGSPVKVLERSSPVRPTSTEAALPSSVSSRQAGRVGRGRRPPRPAPLALTVIAALVLVAAIALAFVLGL